MLLGKNYDNAFYFSNQGLPKDLKYLLLSQERVKLQTSNLTGTFTGSIQTKAH